MFSCRCFICTAFYLQDILQLGNNQTSIFSTLFDLMQVEGIQFYYKNLNVFIFLVEIVFTSQSVISFLSPLFTFPVLFHSCLPSPSILPSCFFLLPSIHVSLILPSPSSLPFPHPSHHHWRAQMRGLMMPLPSYRFCLTRCSLVLPCLSLVCRS